MRVGKRVLKKQAQDLPAEPGVYRARLVDGEIMYPFGYSNVIYIGESGNVRKRAMWHLRWSSPSNPAFYNYNGRCGVAFDFERADKRALRTRESAALDQFVKKFGSVPICNGEVR